MGNLSQELKQSTEMEVCLLEECSKLIAENKKLRALLDKERATRLSGDRLPLRRVSYLNATKKSLKPYKYLI